MRAITEDRFWDAYVPQTAPSGDTVWTFSEARTHPTTHVWSLVDGDRGQTYAVPGFHVVNVFGYTVTAHPWPSETRDAVWKGRETR